MAFPTIALVMLLIALGVGIAAVVAGAVMLGRSKACDTATDPTCGAMKRLKIAGIALVVCGGVVLIGTVVAAVAYQKQEAVRQFFMDRFGRVRPVSESTIGAPYNIMKTTDLNNHVPLAVEGQAATWTVDPSQQSRRRSFDPAFVDLSNQAQIVADAATRRLSGEQLN